MRNTLFAVFVTIMLASLGGCMVVPVHDGYGYGYVEPRVSVVVPFGYYGDGHYRHSYRNGPRGRW